MKHLFGIVAAGLLGACGAESPVQSAALSPDTLYCTQFGPITMRADAEKASGIFSIRQNGDMGVIVGPLSGNEWAARWYETGSAGDIEFTFTPDRAGFTARYRLDREPDKWYEGWTGRRRPDSGPAEITDGDLTLYCL